MKARPLIVMCAAIATRVASAGPLSFAPTVTVASEYSSNPFLLVSDAHSASDFAAIINAPFTYQLDSSQYFLTPAARYSDNGKYSSLNSNFVHVTGGAKFLDDLTSLSLSSGYARDSSLYASGVSFNGVGVQAESINAIADAQRSLSERVTGDVGVSYQRTTYSQSSGVVSLTNNRYLSESPTFSYAITERTTAQIVGGVSQYRALNGLTSSNDYNLQLGFQRALTEIWNLSATFGYSKSYNSEKFYFGPFYLGSLDTQQKGNVYNASVTRLGEVVTLTASASRAFRPTGFAFLSKQDALDFHVNYAYSERWGFGASSTYNKTSYPISATTNSQLQFLSSQLTSDWHWTPEWTLSLRATYTIQRFYVPAVSAHSTGLSFQVTRQFYRIEL